MRVASHSRQDYHSGFTLMEVLVAMVLLATCLSVLMQLFSGGLRLRRTAKDYTEATLHANAQMETLLLTEPLEPGTSSGTIDDRFRWQTQVSEIELIQEESESDLQTTSDDRLLLVSVKILWGDGDKSRKVELDTVIPPAASKQRLK